MKRKLGSALVISTLVVAGLASSASAAEVTKFKTIGIAKSVKPGSRATVVRFNLFPPGRRNNRVGNARLKFSPRRGGLKVKGFFAIGGGAFAVKGDFGRRDHRISIVDGTGRWAGAGGMVGIYNNGPREAKFRVSVQQ